MQIDYSKTINTLLGTPYKNDSKDLTLGDVVAEALATYSVGGQDETF